MLTRNDWLAAPTQVYWSTLAPLALLAPCTVRHLPLLTLRSAYAVPPVHSNVHRWFAAPTQVYWSTLALLALLAPCTVRHFPLCRFFTYPTRAAGDTGSDTGLDTVDPPDGAA